MTAGELSAILKDYDEDLPVLMRVCDENSCFYKSAAVERGFVFADANHGLRSLHFVVSVEEKERLARTFHVDPISALLVT